jgi:hypothetical protein
MVTCEQPARLPKDGVRTLARGRSRAVRAGVWAWYLAAAGEAAAAAEHITRARAVLEHADRRDRHAAAILLLAAEGSPTRAAGLASEHLVEFPDDRVVAFAALYLAPRGSGVSTDAANDQRAPGPFEQRQQPPPSSHYPRKEP